MVAAFTAIQTIPSVCNAEQALCPPEVIPGEKRYRICHTRLMVAPRSTRFLANRNRLQSAFSRYAEKRLLHLGAFHLAGNPLL
ncbi:hypothetical protein KCP75_20065 [Salmonella enterica subsp. enterica]|nr:hypothetical protein KCP75_20065 [Salmonella enterica subsp. enterica]